MLAAIGASAGSARSTSARSRSCRSSACSIVHGIDHSVPLFLASFAGFVVALPGIASIPKMRALALREARQEYAEYYFLFPLFLSITLLTKAGFFDRHAEPDPAGHRDARPAHRRVRAVPGSHVPLGDSRQQRRRRLRVARRCTAWTSTILHLFAMAQIAGYALGGCWTHIGCAQSVVAYAFIQRDVDEHYTPVQWIKEMTPVILEMMVVMTVIHLYRKRAAPFAALTKSANLGWERGDFSGTHGYMLC